MSYKIVRFYFDSARNGETVSRGLTLEQAQAHCKDPETSSSTATGIVAAQRTADYGPWFDGYREETP